MTYTSPLEHYDHFDPNLAYTKKLSDVIVELLAARYHDSIEHARTIALHPPRLIRAVIDYKIAHPEKPFLERLVIDSIATALDFYQSSPNAVKDLEMFLRRIHETGNNELLDAKIEQKDDSTTWKATNPTYSQETVERMKRDISQKDIVLISLGHGSIAAGMDVFLRYIDQTQSQDSLFYVSRFSRIKHGDNKPQLTPTEIAILKEASSRRSVVVFDEDVNSGETKRRALSYFQQEIGSRINFKFNYAIAPDSFI